METNDKNIHVGHRQRLKDKVRESGLKVLKDHEVMELLLTYTIPQKDTNPTGHKLLDAFGNLAGVLNADYKDLKKVKGVGEETALFLSLFTQVFELYLQDKTKKDIFLRDTKSCVDFFRDNYSIQNSEVLYVICLNSMSKFVKAFEIKGYSDSGISLDIKQIAEQITSKNIKNIVLYHTHPAGSVEPSKQDIIATNEILQICCLLNVNLCDHLIFNETEHFSFGASGWLHKLYNDCSKQFPNNANIKTMMQNIDFVKDVKVNTNDPRNFIKG